jgi:hypothetical protein
MSTETIVGIAITIMVILSLGFVVKLIAKRKPREKFFKCSRCGTTARHTERTIKAWRNFSRSSFAAFNQRFQLCECHSPTSFVVSGRNARR